MVFHTVLYLVRTKNIKQIIRDTFLQLKKKKQISTYTASWYGLDTWEGSLIIKGVTTYLASQEEGHLIFIFNTNFPYLLMFPFLK